jgi:predicted ATPase with chaperone activity
VIDVVSLPGPGFWIHKTPKDSDPMSEQRKLSPSEFLAQLKQRASSQAPSTGGGKAAPKPAPRSTVREESSESVATIVAPEPDETNEPIVDPATLIEQLTENGSASKASSNGHAANGARAVAPEVLGGNSKLAELFDRVNTLLSGSETAEELFRPQAPASLEETGLNTDAVQRLALKFLAAKGSSTGRAICNQIRLPFHIVEPVLKHLKQDQLVTFRGAAEMGDYEYAITAMGRERAAAFNEECMYFGSAPVPLHDYLKAMAAQSISKQEASEEDLRNAFSDLILSEPMLERLGPAINSGRGMFLYGQPGNGKTSIAERVMRCFHTSIWIPRVLSIGSDIVRLFDPGLHEVIEEHEPSGLIDRSDIDQRWVQIARPTVIAGGELTMDELEIVQNQQTKICEAPLQLKSNCGALVIDDFGRQTMPVEVLLNRWIVPLEKRFDFLNLPGGRKVQVPFDQLIIFSTNLEPKDLVDSAFLRRIPYKIEVADPSEEEFRALCELMAPLMGFEYDRDVVNYLIETHYKGANRAFRACHPRDLLQQVRNFCTFKKMPRKLTREGFDFAVANFFSAM